MPGKVIITCPHHWFRPCFQQQRWSRQETLVRAKPTIILPLCEDTLEPSWMELPGEVTTMRSCQNPAYFTLQQANISEIGEQFDPSSLTSSVRHQYFVQAHISIRFQVCFLKRLIKIGLVQYGYGDVHWLFLSRGSYLPSGWLLPSWWNCRFAPGSKNDDSEWRNFKSIDVDDYPIATQLW